MIRGARFLLVVLAGCSVPVASGQSDPGRAGHESAGAMVVLPELPRPPHPMSFEHAKRALEHRVYGSADERIDVYCGCAYDEHKLVDFDRCESAHPYVPIARSEERARHIEWEHVVPASWIGRTMPCWAEPARDHRSHCRDTSPDFENAEGDMHNLFPSVGQINELRGSDPYGEIDGESHIAGCDFELDERTHVAEPRESVRGDLARATFYVSAVYRVPLRAELYRTLRRWNAADPPDASERRRNDRIERLQGNRNPYVDGRAPLP